MFDNMQYDTSTLFCNECNKTFVTIENDDAKVRATLHKQNPLMLIINESSRCSDLPLVQWDLHGLNKIQQLENNISRELTCFIVFQHCNTKFTE